MLIVVVFAALLGASSAQFRPPGQFMECDFDQLARAQSSFNDDLMIDPSLGVKSYHQLRKAVEQKWISGTFLGLSSVCDAFSDLKRKFNSAADYEACFFDVAGLVATKNGTATGITVREAKGYLKLMTQFDFACGAGYSVFANDDICGSQVFNTSSAVLDACQQSFIDSSEKDPANVCSYANIAAVCYRNTFFKCSIAMAWWACEYERIGTVTYIPQCSQNFCTFNP